MPHRTLFGILLAALPLVVQSYPVLIAVDEGGQRCFRFNIPAGDEYVKNKTAKFVFCILSLSLFSFYVLAVLCVISFLLLLKQCLARCSRLAQRG